MYENARMSAREPIPLVRGYQSLGYVELIVTYNTRQVFRIVL